MKEDADMTDVCDRLQDVSREVGKLTKAIAAKDTPAPVVNVTPKIAAPTVQAPSVNVTSPVTVVHERVTGWTFNVTSRDNFGRIKTFTAQPTVSK